MKIRQTPCKQFLATGVARIVGQQVRHVKTMQCQMGVAVCMAANQLAGLKFMVCIPKKQNKN